MNSPTTSDNTATQASYVLHLIHDKPVMLTISAVASQLLDKLIGGVPSMALNMGAITLLVTIDWFTKMRACRKRHEAITSKTMREKGFYKLRDYFTLYLASALTVPLLGDMWGVHSVLYIIGFWELWSIAENLYDGGDMPFDVRSVAVFDGIRQMLKGGSVPTPYSPPGTSNSSFPGRPGGVPGFGSPMAMPPIPAIPPTPNKPPVAHEPTHDTNLPI